MGGEEFLIVFLNSDLSSAPEITDRCFKALQHMQWSHGKPITISGGMSVYTKNLSYSKFIETADTNLYKAKNNGKNRAEY